MYRPAPIVRAIESADNAKCQRRSLKASQGHGFIGPVDHPDLLRGEPHRVLQPDSKPFCRNLLGQVRQVQRLGHRVDRHRSKIAESVVFFWVTYWLGSVLVGVVHLGQRGHLQAQWGLSDRHVLEINQGRLQVIFLLELDEELLRAHFADNFLDITEVAHNIVVELKWVAAGDVAYSGHSLYFVLGIFNHELLNLLFNRGWDPTFLIVQQFIDIDVLIEWGVGHFGIIDP